MGSSSEIEVVQLFDKFWKNNNIDFEKGVSGFKLSSEVYANIEHDRNGFQLNISNRKLWNDFFGKHQLHFSCALGSDNCEIEFEDEKSKMVVKWSYFLKHDSSLDSDCGISTNLNSLQVLYYDKKIDGKCYRKTPQTNDVIIIDGTLYTRICNLNLC